MGVSPVDRPWNTGETPVPHRAEALNSVNRFAAKSDGHLG